MAVAALITHGCIHAYAFCVVLVGTSIHLVERRGRKDKLDPKRQVDISTLLESIPEAAIIIDSEGHVVDANSAAGSLIGKTREQLRTSDAGEIARLLEKTEEHHEPVVRRALQGHTVRHERHIAHHPDGRVHELLVSANPIHDDHGQAIAALLIARDVTELSQLQRRVGDIERHRAIGQMAAALAHDFNNILDTIGQAAAMLEVDEDRPASERRPLLGMIQNTVHRGAQMVQRIREYLRTGQGALRPLNLCNIVDEAVELTSPLWRKANVDITKHLESTPNVFGNAADLHRVFTNLIINAIEAMPEGGHITISCQKHGNNVVATVCDTGMGIAPDAQKKVFYAYFTTKPSGTGLGLSGAQKILLAHGGNITFRTTVGKGTTFTIVVPIASEDPRVANA